VPLELAIFTSEPFTYHRIRVEAGRMRRLGMSLRAIGRALGVDEKTVRNTLARGG
jgi:transposase-like protein